MRSISEVGHSPHLAFVQHVFTQNRQIQSIQMNKKEQKKGHPPHIPTTGCEIAGDSNFFTLGSVL